MKATESVRPCVSAKIGIECLLLAGGVLLCGCASTSRLAAPLGVYSAATADASTMTGSALETIGALDAKVQSTPKSIASNHISELRESSFPSFLGPADLLQRELAVVALSTYAAKLKELASINESDALSKSASSAGTAIESIVSNIDWLSTRSANAVPPGVVSGLTSLAGNLLNVYVAAERDQVLTQVLEKNNPIVTNICGLMAGELEPANAGFIYKHVEHDFRMLEEDADQRFKQAKDGEKSAIAAEYLGTLRQKDYTLCWLRSLASLYSQIAATHSAILAQSRGGERADAALGRLADDLAMASFYSSQLSTK